MTPTESTFVVDAAALRTLARRNGCTQHNLHRIYEIGGGATAELWLHRDSRSDVTVLLRTADGNVVDVLDFTTKGNAEDTIRGFTEALSR